jgi:hypothetical protein
MPVPLQLIASVLIGLALALAAFSQFEHGRPAFGRDIWVPLLYQGLVATPAILYVAIVHPDWSWLYWVDPARLPFGTTTLVVIAAAAAELGGYLAGWALLRTRHRRELMLTVAALALVLLVLFILLHDRLVHAGTFSEFTLGTAARTSERKLGWALGIVDVGLIVGLALSVRFLLVQGERERGG